MGCAADVEKALTFNHTMLGSRWHARQGSGCCRCRPLTCVITRPVEIKRSAPPPRPPPSTGSSSSSNSVFISNLPTDAAVVSSELLRDAFAHCGTITNVVRD